MKLARRYQILASTGWCEDCRMSLADGDDTAAEKAAASHAAREGHQVRVVQSRLIIIEPQPAPEAERA